jgi:predicted glycosyltransferase
VLVTGPFMPADQRRDLERRARAQRVGVRMSVSDPLSYVHAADVVVGMAGYSSTVETLRSGTPLVLVPRVGPSAEQRMRSALFAERGWTGRVDPDDVNGERLAEAIYERLSYAGPTAPRPTGLDVVVSHLLETLSPTELDVAESDVAQLLPTV